MDVPALLMALRAGRAVPPEAMREFALGLASGAVSDAQAGAFAMAVYLKGLNEPARVALTRGMRDSGATLAWDLPGPVIDKHSTGGIGDSLSLVLAPALAAAGGFVPMISGRGLGHTGGTLDKLEAIPGLVTGMGMEALKAQVARIGCAIVAASDEIAPADRRLYAVRDVTATVECLDLIAPSILSKKLAAGLDALILDVKTGSGAFLTEMAEARALAEALVGIANDAGCRTMAVLTDMGEPNVTALGNALEVAEVVAVLKGEGRGNLVELAVELGGALLALSGLAGSDAEGEARIAGIIASGAAAEGFARMIAAQGGPADFLDRADHYLPRAPVTRVLAAPEAGFLAAIDGQALGYAVVRLGAGRLCEGDEIDPGVGLAEVARIGTAVEKGDPLAVIHAASEDAAERCAAAIAPAFTIGAQPEPVALVQGRVTR